MAIVDLSPSLIMKEYLQSSPLDDVTLPAKSGTLFAPCFHIAIGFRFHSCLFEMGMECEQHL